MKHVKLGMICLVFALAAMVVTEAEAGRIKKPPKGARTEKTEEMKVPHSFDNYPPMQFMGGVLTRSAHTGWMLGEKPLYLRKDCVITVDGVGDGQLEDGRQAVVMGSLQGGAVSAWAIHIAQPEYGSVGLDKSEEPKEAGPNPNVGRILEPVE